MGNDKLNAFRESVQKKINNLLEEFAEGKLNREQFHVLYERYNSQMELADKASDESLNSIAADGGTLAIREKHMGKARGMIIFDAKTSSIVETLGAFTVNLAEVLPVINQFSEQVKAGKTVDRVVKQVSEKQWLLFDGGQYTSIVTLFQNEPSHYQTVVIQRMHKEFEEANHAIFEKGSRAADELVYPFLSFVTRTMRGKS